MSGGPSPWEILGIEPTQDARAIRRAYAGRLRTTSPEDDPEGFKRLREALEWSLGSLERERELVAATQSFSSEPFSMTTSAEEELPAARIDSPERESSLAPDMTAREAARAALNHLYRLLTAEAPSPEVLQHAWSSVADAYAMQTLSVQVEVERAVAHLLASCIPRSDTLLALAVQDFDWQRHSEALSPEAAVLAILHRLRELDWFERIQEPEHPLYSAYIALSEPPRPWLLQLWMLCSRIEHRVRHILTLLPEGSGLRAHFNAEALVWWEGFFAKPRLSRTIIGAFSAAGVLLGLLAAAVADDGEAMRVATVVAGFAVLGAVALAVLKLVAIDGPRYVWIQSIRPRQSLFLEYAWSPVSVGTLWLAIALPPSQFVVGAVGAAGTLCALWLIATIRAEKRDLRKMLNAEVGKIVLKVAAAMGCGLAWFILSRGEPGKGAQVALAALVVATLHEAAGEALYSDLWIRVPALVRRRVLWMIAALALFVGVAPFVLINSAPGVLLPLAVVAWSLLLIQRIPQWGFSPAEVVWRRTPLLLAATGAVFFVLLWDRPAGDVDRPWWAAMVLNGLFVVSTISTVCIAAAHHENQVARMRRSQSQDRNA